ncbi:hypothetical protein C1H46_000920 [Malus baccata]|uniref:RING-type domain-containing protein n=1 Tax=Malus baccata TaxID=106549 RepID=A0A540NRV6_MALBA|nr:hypothetical protein C1H46_000920 [Malus baccata]
MTTNAKFGAALAAAAAAAASRLMPTPHATAIKSRRSAGSGVIQKVLESSELDDNSVVSFNSNGDTNAIGWEVIRTNSNELQVDFGGELLRNGGVLKSENELEQASQVDEASAGNAVEEEKNVSSSYENLTNLDANDVKDTEFSKNDEVVEECKQEIQDLDDNSPCSKESDTEDNEGCGDGKDDGGGGKESKDNNGNIGNGSDIDDDEELGSSITQLVEERIGELESRWMSKKAEKKLRKPLEIAEELEKKQASTALHWEEGAAAQPMRLEGVRRGSTTLGYFNVDVNNPITRTLSSPALRRDHGSPQVLAVHSNYIAIGMARGSTLVIPSKYSAHNADNMDAKMLILGLQGERSYAAVTSLCFNQQGDLLLAGYADGHITVWDVQRASAAKVITGEHTTPVVHTLFLGQDSQVTHQFKAVAGDSKGLVLLHYSSVVPLLNRFSIKTQCLLDGQNTGTVLSASPLLFDEFSGGALLSSQGSGAVSGSSIGGMMGGMVGGDAGWKLFNEGSSLVEEGVVVFVTHHTVLVVRLTPTLEVYARLSKPVGGSGGFYALYCLEIVLYMVNSSHILSKLRSHPISLFLHLKTVIEVHLSGTLIFSSLTRDDHVRVKDKSKAVEAYLERISDFPKLLYSNPVNVTDDMIELYLLLCQCERNSVLKFLETFDSYRVEHGLFLCQIYGITDAASFLLERVGDVSSALLLTLSTLGDKFIKLDTAVASLVNDINSILHACIGLCQRNTHHLNPDESEALWFRLLDSFCDPLTDPFDAGTVSKGDVKTTVAESLDSEEDEMASIIRWRISNLHKGFHILRKLFSQFIKEIVEGMIGYVRVQTIMSKLFSDNGSQEFGDFKFTILGMLSTYGFERRILDTAKSLIEDDTFYTMSILKKGASHGYAPRSQICCSCDCLLDKNSSSYIRIFNCGHATHLQCEALDNGASSSSSSSGCPICMPRKKSQRSRSKSVLPDKSIVKEFLSRTQQTYGTTAHPQASSASENTYSFQQISRFDILTNLQRGRGLVEIDNMPQLRLAPLAVYHEKVQKGTVLSPAESSTDLLRNKVKPSNSGILKQGEDRQAMTLLPCKQLTTIVELEICGGCKITGIFFFTVLAEF